MDNKGDMNGSAADAGALDAPGEPEKPTLRAQRIEALRHLASQAPSADDTRLRGIPGHVGSLAPTRIRRYRGRWGQRTLLVVAALCLVGVLFTVVTVHSDVFGPHGNTVLPAIEDHFYIESDVPWAEVRLDGTPVSISRAGGESPLYVGPGRHSITWEAVPFRLQRCTFTIPISSDFPCASALEVVRNSDRMPNAQVLLLHEPLFTLAPDEQQALMEATQKALDARAGRTSIQPGDLYFTEQGGATAAHQLLYGTLHLSLQADTKSSRLPCSLSSFSTTPTCPFSKDDCQRLCSISWNSAQQLVGAKVSEQDWVALAVVMPTWTYSLPQGNAVATNQPIDAGEAAVTGQFLILAIRYMAPGWYVVPLFGPDVIAPLSQTLVGTDLIDPACAAARDLFVAGGTADELARYAQVRLTSGPDPSDGCLVVAPLRSAGGTPTPSDLTPYFLERCGVLYAVNSQAHEMRPYLPQANEDEQRIAEQLSRYSGHIVSGS